MGEMAVEAEADYTFLEGEFMAMIEPTADIPVPIQPEQASVNVTITDESELTPFERLCARLKGTVVIHGDIVNSDPEDWDCEGG